MIFEVKVRKTFENTVQPLKALFSVTLDNCFRINGIRLLETDGKYFVAMPYTKYTDMEGNLRTVDIFHPISQYARDKISDAVIKAYEFYVVKMKLGETEDAQRPRIYSTHEIDRSFNTGIPEKKPDEISDEGE